MDAVNGQNSYDTAQLVPNDTQFISRCQSVDVNSRFGSKLRELRRSRNMTQLQMAVNFGIDRSFISDVERGRKSISLTFLEVIGLGMRVEISELLRDL